MLKDGLKRLKPANPTSDENINVTNAMQKMPLEDEIELLQK